ncbi:MAG: anion permease [Candidatus Bipolaricaulota bacterium]|nr:MAG: anion permease [Candidatus Bipolaricaulota bacterium]
MLSLIPLFIAGAYVGWNIGANDAGNCVGTTVGSGLLSYRRAILLVAVFVILGALLQGGNVMKTIGKGIVTSELPTIGIIAALVSSGLFVTLATFFRIPVSTSQAIVGGVAGVGLSAGAEMNLAKIGTIAQVWVVCPILTGLLAFVIYWLSRTLLRRLSRESFWQRAPNLLLILSACYVAFALGANDVGNAMGPIANLGIQSSWLGLLGGGALAVGALTFGRRVTETVGSGITPLDPVSAFSAQMAAALAVHFFSILGIPVSTSQSIVGAVIGVGILHGIHTVRKRKIVGIVVGWVATPTAAGLFSFGFYRLLRLVFASPSLLFLRSEAMALSVE